MYVLGNLVLPGITLDLIFMPDYHFIIPQNSRYQCV